MRERFVSQRTRIIDQMRGFILERGVAVRRELRSCGPSRGHSGDANRCALAPHVARIFEDLSADKRRLDGRGTSQENSANQEAIDDVINSR